MQEAAEMAVSITSYPHTSHAPTSHALAEFGMGDWNTSQERDQRSHSSVISSTRPSLDSSSLMKRTCTDVFILLDTLYRRLLKFVKDCLMCW